MSGNRWQVFRSMSGWWGHPLNSCGLMDERAEHFPTHAEAMDYADRMARTITVELPVDLSAAPISRSWKDPTEPWIREYCDPDNGPENSIRLSDDQLEGFALALLTRHYQRKAQQ